MKRITILIVSIIIVSCSSEQHSRYVCNCQEKKQLQEFVKESIKPANNMSDEEMEDVIHQLKMDGVTMFCKKKPVWVTQDGGIDWKLQKIDSCESIMDF